ncbi:type III secretion system translocon subunit SctE [Pseudochelatococcus sp. B33]
MSSITDVRDTSTSALDNVHGRGSARTEAKTAALENTPGAGINGEPAALPGATTQPPSLGALVALTFQALMASLDEKLPGFSTEDTSVLVSEVAAAMDKLQKDVLKEDIQQKAAQRRVDVQELGKQMAKALKAEEEAKKKSGIAKAFSKAMGYIVGSLMVVAGILLTPVSGPAGVALAVVGALMIADQATKDTTGKGIGGHFAKAVGGDEMWGDMGFSIGLAVAGAVAGGFATAALKGVQLAQWVNYTRIGASGVAGAGTIASGGINLDAGITQAKATRKQADTKDFEAEMEQSQAFIDLAMKLLMAVSKRIADVLETGTEVLQDRGQTLSRARLTA